MSWVLLEDPDPYDPMKGKVIVEWDDDEKEKLMKLLKMSASLVVKKKDQKHLNDICLLTASLSYNKLISEEEALELYTAVVNTEKKIYRLRYFKNDLINRLKNLFRIRKNEPQAQEESEED